MEIKNLKVRMASLGLSLALAGGPSIATALPVFAEDDIDVKPIEQSLDETVNEEKTEEVVKEEVKEEVKSEEKVEAVETVNEEKAVEETPVEKTEEVVKEEVKEVVKEEVKSETPTENVKKVEEEKVEATPVETKEETTEEATTNEVTAPKTTTTHDETPNESHKVSVITTKVDTDGKALPGAVMQILDKDGNVVDEWISDGTEHISMLPEGEYILHEKSAPEGYVTAADKTFKVEVVENDINADVEHDDSHDVCWHYGGVPLYYIESKGEREEVYCINQNWDEPDGIDYTGVVLDENNIRTFTPDADKSMSNTALYNKVLDIIYHRSKAEEYFPDLSEVEIRFITEYALKTYTSAEVTTSQAMRDENGKLIRDENGNLIYEDVRFLRQYRYDPESPTGYVEDRDNGNGVGKLAQHWWTAHNHTKIPAEYVELFNYLVSEIDKHPEDMHLYIYSTKNMTADGESYQNLLGVRWFDPYDEDYKVFLSLIDEAEPYVPEEPEKPVTPEKPVKPETPVKKTVEKAKIKNSPQTGDESDFAWALAGLGSSLVALGYVANLRRKENKVKVK